MSRIPLISRAANYVGGIAVHAISRAQATLAQGFSIGGGAIKLEAKKTDLPTYPPNHIMARFLEGDVLAFLALSPTAVGVGVAKASMNLSIGGDCVLAGLTVSLTKECLVIESPWGHVSWPHRKFS